MKKLYTTFVAVLAIIQISSGQNSNPWPTTGNVGIGTTSPQSPLTVVSGTSATGGSAHGVSLLTKNNDVNAYSGIDFSTNSLAATPNISSIRVQRTNTVAALSQDVIFMPGNGTVPTERMRIVGGNGYVGIGTTNPLMQFHLAGPNAKTSTSGYTISFISTNEVAASAPFGLRTSIYGASSLNNRYVSMQTNDYNLADGGNIVLQPTTGSVGIGTTNLATVRINNSSVHTFSSGEARLIVNNTSDSAYSDAIVIKTSPSTPVTRSQGILFADANSMQAAIRAKRLNLSANYQSDLQFYTGDGVSQFQDEANVRMTITHDGLVGIGTKTPDQALTVNGTVHSTVVRVTALVPGPDYVFDNDYKLITLPDLKNYLSKNHHLPEIPSAAEMAKDGLDLGDMNTKLLKKVEELTLYLIDKDKQLTSMESTVSQLKKQVAAIKKGMKKQQHTKSL